MEQEPPILQEAFSEFKTVLRWVLSGLIEAFFVVCWVLIQWIVNKYVITQFTLEGIDAHLLEVFQWIFAISTLAPIVFFLLQLIVTMAVRTYGSIRQVIKKELSK